MPWCDDCARFWTPTSMPPDGSCPTCGAVIAEVPESRIPWHFWVLVVALVLYLGWRVVQLFQWLLAEGHVAIAVACGAVLAGAVAGAAWWNWHPDPTDDGDPGGVGEGPVAEA